MHVTHRSALHFTCDGPHCCKIPPSREPDFFYLFSGKIWAERLNNARCMLKLDFSWFEVMLAHQPVPPLPPYSFLSLRAWILKWFIEIFFTEKRGYLDALAMSSRYIPDFWGISTLWNYRSFGVHVSLWIFQAPKRATERNTNIIKWLPI